MNLIEVKNVKKQYDERVVVDGLSFEVKKGEVFGLLGPNGAGKTTTISMMSAQLDVSGGTILVNGIDANKEAFRVKSMVGVVPQDISLYSVLSANDNLKFFGAIYGLKRKELKQKVDWILDLVGLKDRAKDPIKNYSGGMKRRINIAAALLHDPDVVFMDEPTVGIDPQSRNRIYELIQHLKEQGMTIVYTTHYMEEATLLCDRIAIVDNGRVIEYGTTEELIAKVHGGILELTLQAEAATAAIEAVQGLSHVVSAQGSNNKLSIVVDDAQEAIGTIVQHLKQCSIQVTGMHMKPPTLETLFLHLTGKELRD
ncbi:ABC transporter ATP-binding protein [Paenibacillus sp. NEAU-GSW1]|uniref:ABC transporter ATP-binding protein n=1 Tax=Paenibacillus sp. NEAU-GSW1 TaxID=2682486 RepID=UPI0012E138DF|nr:ABC transporter ATP-binding protein [Paenibacillus sp. NEAU-GSW1]MUT64885.1 ATP-binding cassette domain-containing protein [Paenibacillus sp. NEAU-GSW1]